MVGATIDVKTDAMTKETGESFQARAAAGPAGVQIDRGAVHVDERVMTDDILADTMISVERIEADPMGGRIALVMSALANDARTTDSNVLIPLCQGNLSDPKGQCLRQSLPGWCDFRSHPCRCHHRQATTQMLIKRRMMIWRNG